MLRSMMVVAVVAVSVACASSQQTVQFGEARSSAYRSDVVTF
jgi:hypothetical protein